MLSTARTECPLQRTFTTFPSGPVGAALLGLRGIVGMSAVFDAVCVVLSAHSLSSLIAASLTLLAGIALVLGFLTPVVSAALAADAAALLVGLVSAPLCLLESRMALFEFAAMAVLLVVVGPGAISIDARLFGRREVAISRERPPKDL